MQEDEKLILERLRNICSKSEKCRRDITEKLKQWNFAGDADEIISILTMEGFLDEKRFTHSFVNDKIRFSKWGKNKVRFLLKQKGIQSEFIQQSLDEVPEEEYSDMIEKELIRKSKAIKKGTPYEKKGKLYAFALQRGYDSDITMSLIQKILNV
jgi:regulatory protein